MMRGRMTIELQPGEEGASVPCSGSPACVTFTCRTSATCSAFTGAPISLLLGTSLSRLEGSGMGQI